MSKQRFGFAFVLLIFAGLMGSGCDVLQPDPTMTPIYVTATPDFIIVTNTVTPSPSPVLAPTVPGQNNSTPVSGEPTQPPPPSPTATTLITATPTFTPTPTNTAVTPGAPLYLPVGIGPLDTDGGVAAVPGNCSTAPQGGFAQVYNSDPNLAARLSCPVSGATSVQSAYQPFERGLMIWVSSQVTSPQSAIFALYNTSSYRTFADTWQEGVDPESGGLQPPNGGLQEPIRGFGKVWRESGGVRDELGWASAGESGGNAVIQQYERGTMIYLSQTGQTYVLITGTPGTWTAFSIPF